MRHHTAVQIDGGWRYASVSKRGGHALGNCADHLHVTEEEARECYSKWQRDHIVLDVATSNWCDCRKCGAPTKTGARIEGDGYRTAMFCAEHLTLGSAVIGLHLTEPAGDSWES